MRVLFPLSGPYTIFVPTDKAFRTLLVQLGGPEKAEQKFKDNPRLLSGVSFNIRLKKIVTIKRILS